MPFEIVRNDITNMQVDVIVNAAGSFAQVGAGVDAAIHKKAGPELLAAREKIGYIDPGGAAITPAFGLDAKYVIHASTPVWVDGREGELQLLRDTYDLCLKMAVWHHCESIAFPLLASGNHGFPDGSALQVAIAAFSEFLMEHEMQIYLVVFRKESLRLSENLVRSVTAYIDDHYVAAYEKEIYGASERNRRCYCSRPMPRQKPIAEAPRHKADRDCVSAPCAPIPYEKASVSLSDFLKKKDAGFTETLLALIKKSGKKNSAVYKKANISKQHFSKLINDPDAKPSKPTAIALALALELDMDGTKDLIGRAGYALTDSSTFDLIIRYFIEHRQFNVIEINIALYEFDQPLLGS